MANLGTYKKEPNDLFSMKISYDEVIKDSETISSGTIAAATLAGVDATATILDGVVTVQVSGTATGGSTTTLIDTGKNFGTLGVEKGDRFYNTTQKWVATVTKVSTTTNAMDTLTFATQATAAAASDAYAFLFVKVPYVKGGVHGTDYKVTANVVTSAAREFEDSYILRISDE